MKVPLHRIVFYTADLKQITGKSDRTCQRTMTLMRDFFALSKFQQVTVHHACEFLGLTLDEIMPFIKML
ncbi:hypothetical protein [Pedobacter insulae]|uniref:Uncharacterized protein n=1 Tax=Pedobacter insulae TaxID=414048 RepID=A0A1I2TM12_9SPHI|nr:hypothetical protein [Pedobacter insulae]SFG65940.1 hypothetical protein SAMN04489864_101485 [Pedobacter insulae]